MSSRMKPHLQRLAKADPGVQLGLIGCTLASVIILLHVLTNRQIHDNQEQDLMLKFKEALAGQVFDNNPLQEGTHVPDQTGLIDMTRYAARNGDELVAWLILATTPEGYSGNIRLLVALNPERQILAVRLIDHHETPGFGDRIAWPRSAWLGQFQGLHAAALKEQDWNFKPLGGRFDQVTGATLTPRAVLRAVRRILERTEADNHEKNRALQPNPGTVPSIPWSP